MNVLETSMTLPQARATVMRNNEKPALRRYVKKVAAYDSAEKCSKANAKDGTHTLVVK